MNYLTEIEQHWPNFVIKFTQVLERFYPQLVHCFYVLQFINIFEYHLRVVGSHSEVDDYINYSVSNPDKRRFTYLEQKTKWMY